MQILGGGESTLQKEALSIAVSKTGIAQDDLRLIYAGDLLAQTIASSFGIMGFHRPVYGLYGPCATMGEALSLASMAVAGEFGEYVGAVTSSHLEVRRRISISFGIWQSASLSATWT